jgi:hypothetical protein
MTAAELYEASPVNPRRRATAAEMDERADFYIRYAGEHGPVTVRQLYYRAGVEGVAGIDKTDGGYAKVQRQVLALRRAGHLPYRDIADASRWMRKPATWDSVEEALRETAATYRKALWRDQGVSVEIWLEKKALAGVIYPVTEQYDIALMPTLGFTSETFAFEAIEAADPAATHCRSSHSTTSTGPARTPARRCERSLSALPVSEALKCHFAVWRSRIRTSTCHHSIPARAWSMSTCSVPGGAGCRLASRNGSPGPIKTGRILLRSSSMRSSRTTCGG